MITAVLTDMSNLEDRPIAIPLGVFPPELSVPMPAEGSKPVDYAEALGDTLKARISE